jgi:hypothetical protein
MNPDPVYSAAYLALETDDPGLTGHHFVLAVGKQKDHGSAIAAAPVLGAVPRRADPTARRRQHTVLRVG